jgi:phosphoribosylglycinamide formyltransferase-1
MSADAVPGEPLPVGVLISGRGSNMAALISAAAEPGYPARIACVVSNRAGAPGLEIARAAGIPTQVLLPREFPSRESFDEAVDAELRRHGVQLVCLAGFMRILTPGFIAAWPDRILNVHPSLLPSFRGLHTHERALAAGCRIHGCTVHLVRDELDEGPIIIQAAVPVLDCDDETTLAARVLEQEHRIYPLAVRWLAEGRLRVEGMRVLAGEDAAGVPLVVPAPGR